MDNLYLTVYAIGFAILMFMLFCKPRFGADMSDSGIYVNGKLHVMSESFLVFTLFGIEYSITRHSVQYCTCSFCLPGTQQFPSRARVGRFEVTVPPKGNKWKWTSVTWRVGAWQYYIKLPWQLLPSYPLFVKPNRWRSTTTVEV